MRTKVFLLVVVVLLTVGCRPLNRSAASSQSIASEQAVDGTPQESEESKRKDDLVIYMDGQETVLRETLKDTGVIINRLGATIKLIMPNHLTFVVNTSSIHSGFYRPLNTIAVVLNEYGNTRIKILGYTDSSGDFAANQLLSEDRARSVSSYLIQKGVNPSRLYVQGMSDRFPIVPNDTPAGRAANRRVELHIEPVYR